VNLPFPPFRTLPGRRTVLSTLALPALLSLPLRRARAAPPDTIRIGFAATGLGGRPYCPLTTLAIAHVRGLVAQRLPGTQIEWSFFNGGPLLTETLAAGRLDFLYHGDLPSVVARSAGLRTRLLAPIQLRGQLHLAVPKDSPILSLSDLRGKTVADFKGTALQLAVARVLGSVGLSENDVRTVNMDLATSQAALISGQIDAAFTTFVSEELRQRGLIRYAYSTDPASAALASISGLLVTEDFAAAHPEVVDRVVEAVVDGAHWGSEPANRAAAYELWARSGYPLSAYHAELDGAPLAPVLSPVWDAYAIGRYRAAIADSLRFRLIRRPVDVDAWIDPQPVERALARLNLQTYWPRYGADGNTQRT